MTRFVSCAAHVRSADLGTAVVLVDLETGRVEILLDWARRVWCALARSGRSDAAAVAAGVPVDQVRLLVDELVDGRVLDVATRPRPWVVPRTPSTIPSWGTSEVAAAVGPLRPVGVSAAVLAGVALAVVLVIRDLVGRERSLARIVRLVVASTARPRRNADRHMVSDALYSVRTVASVLPLRVACMEETAAVMVLLALRGRRAVWCHGVATDPIRLHSWITLDGRPVGEPDGTDRYTPLLRIPDDD